MKKIASIFLMSSVILMTGCQTTHHYNSSNYPHDSIYPTQQNSLEIISQRSQEAQDATNSLVKFTQQFNETLDYKQRSFENDQIKINYIGKPDNLLSSIAYRYGYRYVEVGNYRDLPTVNFTDYWTTPQLAVTNVDAQLKETADIAVDKQAKSITLIYK